MKLPFTKKSDNSENAGVNVPQPLSIAFQKFVHRNTPNDFDRKYELIEPFVTVGLILWPAYWAVRGVQWAIQRPNINKLPKYINQTFLRAKLMQLGLCATALFYVTFSEPLTNAANMTMSTTRQRKSDDGN